MNNWYPLVYDSNGRLTSIGNPVVYCLILIIASGLCLSCFLPYTILRAGGGGLRQVDEQDPNARVPLYALWMLEVCLRDQLGNEEMGAVQHLIRSEGALDQVSNDWH